MFYWSGNVIINTTRGRFFHKIGYKREEVIFLKFEKHYANYEYSFNDGAYRFYQNENQYMLVATDNIMLRGQVSDIEIPDKGKIFTAFSAEFSSFAEENGFNTAYIYTDTEGSIPHESWDFIKNEKLSGRTSLLKKLPILPVKFTAYCHLVDELNELYATGRHLSYGIELPDKLHVGDKLPAPVLLLTYAPFDEENAAGKVLNPSEVSEIVRRKFHTSSFWVAANITGVTLHTCSKFFEKVYKYAYDRWVIIAKTSFRIGLDSKNHVYFTGEFLTPESSLFWDAADFYVGEYPKSFGREVLKKYFATTREGSSTQVPRQILLKARQRYIDLYEKLF